MRKSTGPGTPGIGRIGIEKGMVVRRVMDGRVAVVEMISGLKLRVGCFRLARSRPKLRGFTHNCADRDKGGRREIRVLYA